MIEKLSGILPKQVYDEISKLPAELNAPLRMAHFLAQCAHESSNFTVTHENLNYSEDGLNKIFPKYFPSGLAKNYARQPEKIANRIYANRMGNGDEASGDGWRHRGFGYVQVTGKNNQASFGKTVGKDFSHNAEEISTIYPLQSAAWFWTTNHLSPIADKGAADNVINIRKVVNGGVIGLSDCVERFIKYYDLLKV